MKRLFFSIFLSLFSITLIHSQDATPASLYNDGLAALKAKDYATAYDLMSKAAESADPEADAKVLSLAKKNGAIAAYYHGSGLYKQKDLEGAMAVHNSGINMNPKFYGNYIGNGKIYNKQGKTVDAVTAYLKAGEIRTQEGKADKAQGYYNKAENIIAIAYSKKKKEDAMAASQLLLEAKETAEAHYYMSKIMMDNGSKADALAHAIKASELGADGQEGKYIFQLGEAYEANGNDSKAMENYNKVGQGKYYEMAQYKINHKSR